MEYPNFILELLALSSKSVQYGVPKEDYRTGRFSGLIVVCVHNIAICNAMVYIVSMQRRWNMATAVRVSDLLLKEARLVSSVENRSVTGQIEYWAKIGKCAEENPDLTYNLIKDILFGLEELEHCEVSEYKFG